MIDLELAEDIVTFRAVGFYIDVFRWRNAEHNEMIEILPDLCMGQHETWRVLCQTVNAGAKYSTILN